MTWTQTELDLLKQAYAAGVLTVRYDGKTTQYGSDTDLLRRIRTLEREINTSAGTAQSNRSFAKFSKG